MEKLWALVDFERRVMGWLYYDATIQTHISERKSG